MRDINTVCLSGRLVRDPELRALPSGASVCGMSIAVNESYKQGDEWQEQASFFDVVLFGAQGENAAKYLSKGSPITLQGSLRQRTWETQDGQKRSKVEVIANLVIFPPKPVQPAAEPTPPAGDYSYVDFGNDNDPSIPF